MEKNSEDEDGQLEEQIERLQEKVESAQSEQKNLFLVIFQVRPEPGSGSLTPVLDGFFSPTCTCKFFYYFFLKPF